MERMVGGGMVAFAMLTLVACTTTARTATTAPLPVPMVPATNGSASPGARTPPILSVSGAKPGGHASATVHAAPHALCVLTYRMANDTIAQAAGLDPQRTDARGDAHWQWYITTLTPPGIGSAVATCDGVSSLSVHVIIGGVQEPPGSG